MKRLSNLYEQIISLDNLRLADEKARKGKLRSYGVKRHDRNREANILALHESLKNKTFVNSKYEVFIIRDPKERLIYRLPYYLSLIHILTPPRIRVRMSALGFGKNQERKQSISGSNSLNCGLII